MRRMTKCECGKETNPNIYCKHGKEFVFFCSDSCLYKYMEEKFRDGVVLAARVSE